MGRPRRVLSGRTPAAVLPVVLAGLLAILSGLLPARAAAQAARLEGRVVSGPDSTGLEGRQVVLHRVSADTGMAVDSARSGAGGAFAFPLPPSDSQDVFLVTARHEGVLYYGSAIHGSAPPEDYRVAVFPARRVEDGSALVILTRTLVMAREGDSLRVMDVVDVRGDPARTLVGPGGTGQAEGDPAAGAGVDALPGAGGAAAPGRSRPPWWSVALPAGAVGARVLPGAVGPEEVRFTGGVARLSAVVPPSGQRLVLGYVLEGDRPLELVLGHPVEQLEVLVRHGTVEEATGLADAGSLQLSTATLERWRGHDLAPGDTVRVVVRDAGGGGSLAGWIAMAVGGVLAAAAAWSWRRAASGTSGGSGSPREGDAPGGTGPEAAP